MKKVKLICGAILNPCISQHKLEEYLIKTLGDLDYKSPPLAFNYTDYYRPEMGENLKRIFYAFTRLRKPGKLYKTKIKTGKIEKKFSMDGKRKVNLDPGYIALSKLVLFSTKNFSHRIYMGESVFSEITLIYQRGRFTSLPWTFPDYKSEKYKRVLSDIRKKYKKQLGQKNGA